MATTKEAEQTTRPLDTVLLVLAALAAVAGIVAYYWFADAPIVVRVLSIFAGLGVALLTAYQTDLGKGIWQFALGSRVEIRKVIWPNRQETTQTTIAVVVIVLIMGVFFWVLDLGLLYITRALTGQGG